MRPNESKEKVLALFDGAMPSYTVAYGHPNSVRPPLPYIILEFGRLETAVTENYIVDGEIFQRWRQSYNFTAELVKSSAVSHAEGTKTNRKASSTEELMRMILYLKSHTASQIMQKQNIWVTETGEPEPIYNSVSGVERVRCSFRVDFISDTKDYTELYENAKSLGYFTEAEILEKQE